MKFIISYWFISILKYLILNDIHNNINVKIISIPNDTRAKFIVSRLDFNSDPPESDEMISKFKMMCNNQREILHLMLEIRPIGNVPKGELTHKNHPYSNLINLNLYQTILFENLMAKFQDIEAHNRMVSHITRTIERNQNPKICKNLEVITYKVASSYDFEYQIYNIAYLLQMALGKGKPLVISENIWQGFKSIFEVLQPLSHTCRYNMIRKNRLICEIINLQNDYSIQNYMPQILPTQLIKEIKKFHSSPFVWYIGQIIAYILRIYTTNEHKLKKIQLNHLIVGVHLAKTDKLLLKAKLALVIKYMDIVELYFKRMAIKRKIAQKYVYFSNDDPRLLEIIRIKYPHYIFITSQFAKVRRRIKKTGPYTIWSDIYHLSQTDYLVCSFTSDICKLAYEWMNSRHIDSSEKYYSFDQMYYYERQIPAIFMLLIDHATDNTYLKANTKVKWIRRNELNVATVKVMDSNKVLDIPLYKLQEIPITENFRAFQ